MKYIKSSTDIDFLANYWLECQKIGRKIVKDLPKESIINSKHLRKINPKSDIKMFLIDFKDLGNKWDVYNTICKHEGKSETLEILASKIKNMIDKGRAKDVKVMVERIINKGIKNLVQPGYSESKWVTCKDGVNEKNRNLGNIGKGHFRWNYGAHTLTTDEIKRLKNYFKL